MRYHKNLRVFLPLAIAGMCVSFAALSAMAQRPEDPGRGRPRPGRQGVLSGNGGETPAPAALRALAPGVTRVPVVFSGGHETDPRDRGRPVILVANALGVTPEIFREAFSHVRPAQAGSAPEPAQVQQNKAALLNALGKYGVDNAHLDAASNCYRYVPGRGGLWTNRPAVANALVKNGVVIGYEIVQGGAGYSSPPTVSVPNLRTGTAAVKLAFGKNLATNGSIVAIMLAQENSGSR